MKHKFISLLGACVAWLFVSTIPVCAQANPSQCVSKITERLERLGQAAEFDFLKAREIMNQFDFGTVQAAVSDPAKAAAFKRVFTSLSEFIDLAPNDISGKAMKGYTRFSGGIIRSNGTDFVGPLKKVFGGFSFDGQGFDGVMKQIIDSGEWLDQKTWKSPGGLVYKATGEEGHRLTHIFAHTIDDSFKSSHGVWNVSRQDLLPKIDEIWTNKPYVQDQTIGTRRRVIKDAQEQVGARDGGISGSNVNPSSMTHVAYILEGDEIITAYPVPSTFRF